MGEPAALYNTLEFTHFYKQPERAKKTTQSGWGFVKLYGLSLKEAEYITYKNTIWNNFLPYKKNQKPRSVYFLLLNTHTLKLTLSHTQQFP